jgi:hypothetical protein
VATQLVASRVALSSTELVSYLSPTIICISSPTPVMADTNAVAVSVLAFLSTQRHYLYVDVLILDLCKELKGTLQELV